MPSPSSEQARLFFRIAWQRLADANFLLDNDRTTGAVYLAGYGVECMLKALVLNQTPRPRLAETFSSFRGQKSHDINHLKQMYRKLGGPTPPGHVSKEFSAISTWSTELRYQPGTIPAREAKSFLNAVTNIMHWAEGRF